MDRLSTSCHQTYPLTTFHRCQLCGYTDDDICAFRMWTECDDADNPELGNVIIACQQDACQKIIDEHPRLYREVPWGRGEPGAFMLLCSDCTFRQGVTCTHPALKKNGGTGLDLYYASSYPRAVVCWRDERGDSDDLHCSSLHPPFSKCAGKEP